MALSNSGYNSQIKLSPEEMLEVSQEIHHEFVPDFSIEDPEPTSQYKLSPEEMLEISQEIHHAYAPKISIEQPEPASQHALSPKEMLAISEEIRQDFAPKASNNPQEVVLLPVDPDHIYVYWNLGDDQPNTAQKIEYGNPLTLRIYPESGENADITITKPWFDVAIAGSQAQQRVPIPTWAHETAYRATIGKREPDNSFAPLAASNLTHVPPGKIIPHHVTENQSVLAPMPQLMRAGGETSHYTNHSASGQVYNQQLQ
jgi:hypothetical protein